MIETYQKTISRKIRFSGVGLHSGLNSTVNLIPAGEDQGIVFKRIDVNEQNIIEAKFSNVSSARLCTTLENKFGIKVSTVEHLLAAIYIAGIDNVTIEIDNEEVPIMDGSAKDFVKILKKSGLKTLEGKRKFVKIKKKIELKEGEKKINITPSNNSFDVKFTLNYKNNPLIHTQTSSTSFNEKEVEDIYSARTFCLFEDIEAIKKVGLAKGGSLDNAIVVKGRDILNKGGLRNSKEFVNHKILDCIGDLFTSGYRIIGSIKCSQGGHYLTNQLLRKVFSDNSNFSIIEIQEKNLPHTLINRSLLRSIA